MRRLAALAPIAALMAALVAACGSSEDAGAGPGQAQAGEIQALANAQAMLDTREDEAESMDKNRSESADKAE